MAYDDQNWAVVVEGGLSNGEVWANRWSITDVTTTADIADATTAFRDFYLAWSNACSDNWSADLITFRNALTSEVQNPAWASIPGQLAASNSLPSECALRVSLSAAPNRHGGPFLCGLSVSAVDDEGRLTSALQTTFGTALQALVDDLLAADWALALDSPTDEVFRVLTAMRLGRTFDVIRRRRNQVPEAFVSITVP